MLTIDPAKRATIEEIIYHRWTTLGGEDKEFEGLINESMRPSSPLPLEPLNEIILQYMTRLNFDRQQIIEVRHTQRNAFVYSLLFVTFFYPLNSSTWMCTTIAV